MMSLSFSGAIVGGNVVLAQHEATFISMSLLSQLTGMIVLNRYSSIPFITAGPSTSLAPIFGAVAQSFARQCAPEAWMPTTIVCFMLLSFFSGLVLYTLSHPRIRMGHAAAFLPTPVLMGTMVAIGFTLMVASVQISTGIVVLVTSPDGPIEYRGEALPTEGPAILRAALQAGSALVVGTLLFCCRFFKRQTAILMMPTIMLASILIFYAVALLAVGADDASLRASKWLAPKMTLKSPLDAFASSRELLGGLSGGHVDWVRLFDLRTSPLQVFPLFCAVNILLVVGFLPVLMRLPPPAEREAVDPDHELKVNGLAAMAGGSLGVPAASYLIGCSMQHRDLRGDRASGKFIIVQSAMCLVLGPTIASIVPRFILGGLFLNFGFAYCASASTLAMTRSEHLVLWSTATAYVCLGGMVGLMLGLILTSIVFIVEQSQLDAAELVDSVDKEAKPAGGSGEPAEGAARPQNIAIALKGSIFFATAHHLTEEIVRMVDAIGPQAVGGSSVCLNFTRVQAVDVSAIHALRELQDKLGTRNWELRCSGLRSRLAARFLRVGLCVAPAPGSAAAATPGDEPTAAAPPAGPPGALVRAQSATNLAPPPAALARQPTFTRQASIVRPLATVVASFTSPKVGSPGGSAHGWARVRQRAHATKVVAALLPEGGVEAGSADNSGASFRGTSKRQAKAAALAYLGDSLFGHGSDEVELAELATATQQPTQPSQPMPTLSRACSRADVLSASGLDAAGALDADAAATRGGTAVRPLQAVDEFAGAAEPAERQPRKGGGLNYSLNNDSHESLHHDERAAGFDATTVPRHGAAPRGLGKLRYAIPNDSVESLHHPLQHTGSTVGLGQFGGRSNILPNDSVESLALLAGLSSARAGGSAESEHSAPHPLGRGWHKPASASAASPAGGGFAQHDSPPSGARERSHSVVSPLLLDHHSVPLHTAGLYDAEPITTSASEHALGGGGELGEHGAGGDGRPPSLSRSASEPAAHASEERSALVSSDLGRFGEMFRLLGCVEDAPAQTTILSPTGGEVATDCIYILAGDALLWIDRRLMDAAESRASFKVAGSIIGAAEVLLATARQSEVRMLTDGQIVRLSTANLMRLRESSPTAWEILILKALQAQANTANDNLFH